MQSGQQSQQVGREPKISPRRLKFLRICAGIMAGLFIFMAGVGVGDGRISTIFGSNTTPVATGLPSQLDYSSVNQVYQSLKENYDGQLSTTQLIAGLKHGLAAATGDPYTEFFTAKEAQDFTDELNNTFSGIGAQLSADDQGNIEIISPIKDYPAAKAGLKPKDVIVAIDGTSTSGMSVGQAVDKIRGKAGTQVKLQVVRDKSQILNFVITRQNIQLPSVTYKVLDGNIGYMQISTFGNDTAELAQKGADSFKSKHVKGIILDLREDPGGLLNAAVSVSSLWLPSDKMIVQERGTIGTNSHYSNGNDELTGIPTVVLVDGGTASASEITTAALHDNNAAYVIGEKSYGKGVVQQIVNFGDGSELKVTVASWYRPNGQNINKKGITPDQVVKLTDTDAKAGNDTQLKAAEVYLADK